MLNIYPEFYDAFHCLAATCPDSCCVSWAVVVDEDAAEHYRRVPGALGEKLREVMETDEDGDLIFRMEGGRCPFFDADGLCRIQRELGEEGLCQTCFKFPRLTHDYGHFIEHGLTLACPEAARLILTQKGPRKLIQRTDDTPEEETNLDEDWLSTLQTLRRQLLDELWSADCGEEEALAVCLLHTQWAQDYADGFDPAPFDREAALTAVGGQGGQSGVMEALLQMHRELEILTPQWAELLREAAQWTDPLPSMPQTGILRPLAEEYLYRYWLQAADDDDLLGRMILLGVNALVVRRLAQVKLAKTGELTIHDLLWLCQLYSKEVEHDEVNREMLLEKLLDDEGLAVDEIAGVCLKT
ncbi:MAG: hypothetical protein E7459_01645 [Ruminococcaceae bacterium]|nr:hypothetical protein [Oscillospiraceae bacterium]